MTATSEGIKRGELLVGPIEEEGRDYVWTVVRVQGRHSVEAVTLSPGVGALQITINTSGANGTDHPFQRVTIEPGNSASGGMPRLVPRKPR